MTPPRKLSKLSSILINKKTLRRNRNRARKLVRLLIPLSIIISVISLCLIIFLVKIIRQPFLISPMILSLTDDSGNDDKYISELEKILQDKKISYSTINKLSNSTSIKLTNSGEVIISSQKDLSTQINSLQYLLSRLTMESKDFTRLDLRFDKPVIVLR